MQAWKDIENFLHGDRSALHDSGRQQQQLSASSVMNDMHDELMLSSQSSNEYMTFNNDDNFVDVIAAASTNMFPGPGDAGVISPTTTTTTTIRSLGPDRTTMIPSHGNVIIPAAGNIGTGALPGHGAAAVTAAWGDCFTPPLSPTADVMADVDLTDFNFIVHPSSRETAGAATAQHGSSELDAAPPALNACQHDYADAYLYPCLLYTSPSPRDRTRSRMPSSA